MRTSITSRRESTYDGTPSSSSQAIDVTSDCISCSTAVIAARHCSQFPTVSACSFHTRSGVTIANSTGKSRERHTVKKKKKKKKE
jgi:hypothetical protein